MDTKIFVMTHKKFYPPSDSLYIPMLVGAKGKEDDFSYLRDDTGDNISDLNWLFGELTGLYWIHKNDTGDENVGINHYRRYFRGSDGDIIKSDEVKAYLSEYDIIASTLNVSDFSNEETYKEAHNIKDLYSLYDAVKRVSPEYSDSFGQTMKDNSSYYGNLCIMPRPIFNDYCNWLFSVFLDVMPFIDVSSYDLYHKRIYGFLSEFMMMVYTKKNSLSVKECPIIYTAEKAETEELLLAVSALLKEKKTDEANQLLNDFINLRPDVLLPLSDIKGNLSVARHILYVSAFEEKNNISGLLTYSTDLNTLLPHYKRVHKILEKGDHKTPEDNAYLKDTKVSDQLIQVMTEDDLYERIRSERIKK